MSYQTILFEIESGAARLTLNRPHKLNSFNVQMHEELRNALDRIERDTSVRTLLLTGAGRAFCAGQDLSDRAVAPSEVVDLGASIQNYYAPLVRRLRALRIPVVCGVNGVAAGAGANLAFACDLVIAGKSASFIESFCKVGLVPDTGGTYFLPRLIGTARALGFALLGDKISAEQAAEWGLIWKCVDDNKLPNFLVKLIERLASAPTKALARIKEAIYRSGDHSLDQQLDMERDFMRELGFSSDYREGVSAFLEKRPPRFIGE